MRIIRLPVMCALLIFAPRGAGAQVTPQIAPLITHNPAHPDLCRTYQNSTPSTLNRPSGFVLAEGEARDIRTCMMDLAAAVKATLDGQTMEAGQTASEEIVHHELLKEYLAYRRLRRWNLVYQDNYIVR